MNPKLSENYREAFLADWQQIIRIPSRSFPEGGEEGEVQKFVAEKMRETGARVRTFEVADIPGCLEHPLWCGPRRNYKGRPTVVGEFGPEDASALIVMAHSDTVPIFCPEKWKVDPFGGEIKNGRIYGLGSGDDKWGVATILAVMRAIAAKGKNPEKRLVFISTIDEENGVGNGLLLLMLSGIRAEAALYLDGCQKQVTIGNPGGSNLYLRPVSEIDAERLDKHAKLLQDACEEVGCDRRPLFERPFFRQCRDAGRSFVFYRRQDSHGPFFMIAFYMPIGETKESVRKQLEDMVARTLGKDVSLYALSYRNPWFEPSIIPADTPLIGYLSKALREETRAEPVVNIGGKQDSFVFRNHAGIPTVSFGVSRIDKEGVHQPNENVVIEDGWTGCRIAGRTVNNWLEGG